MMRSKESVEYSYQAEKSIFGIALRAPKGDPVLLITTRNPKSGKFLLMYKSFSPKIG